MYKRTDLAKVWLAAADILPYRLSVAHRWGSWVSATEEEGEAQDEEMPDAPSRAEPKQEEQEDSMIREAAIGKGTHSFYRAIMSRLVQCLSK